MRTTTPKRRERQSPNARQHKHTVPSFRRFSVKLPTHSADAADEDAACRRRRIRLGSEEPKPNHPCTDARLPARSDRQRQSDGTKHEGYFPKGHHLPKGRYGPAEAIIYFNVPSSFASRPAPAHSPMGRYPNPAPSRTPPLRERPRRKVRALSIVHNSGYAAHERMQCPGGAARLGTTPTGEAFPEAAGMQAFSVSAFRRAAPAYGEIPSRKRRLGQPRKRRLKKRPRPENDDAPHRARDPAAP